MECRVSGGWWLTDERLDLPISLYLRLSLSTLSKWSLVRLDRADDMEADHIPERPAARAWRQDAAASP